MTCNTCIKSPIVCPDLLGCTGACPDFSIRRHDTRPAFSVSVSDCDGPLDLTNVIVEVSMWAKAKFKKAVAAADTSFALADNVGFEQSLVGDIIVVERARVPEQMTVVGHDEANKLVLVNRGYHGTTPVDYVKGTPIRMFRILNAFGTTTSQNQDVTQIDGTTTNELIESRVVYTWNPADTCLPGCYWLEFKLLKMNATTLWASTALLPPIYTSATPISNGCTLGAGVEWARRVPTTNEGFLVKVEESPTNENLY